MVPTKSPVATGRVYFLVYRRIVAFVIFAGIVANCRSDTISIVAWITIYPPVMYFVTAVTHVREPIENVGRRSMYA
jgi:hypothetical protein